MDNLKLWENFFTELKVSEKNKVIYLDYVSLLLRNKAPVIFEFEHLSKLIGIVTNTFTNIVNSPHSFYRKFYIAKRKGGKREILSPYPLLQTAQKWILLNILENIKLHDSCYGFVKRRSILDNARQHVGNKELLTIDINDFFGSIEQRRVISVFKCLGYTNKVSYYLSSICCLDGKLPQGACTSPALSNIISKRLDYRLTGLANKVGLTYTRYADDMAFSGEHVPRNLVKAIKIILISEGFSINNEKTKLKVEKSKKIITGLSISTDIVRVPKTYKRELRKDIHYVLNYGLANHLRFKNDFDPAYIYRLLGRVNFLLNIEPENEFGITAKKRLLEKFSNYM
jgi:hypothetical protein